MTPTSEPWTEHMSGRERVRAIVDTLDAPASINTIAEKADVAWETAKSEVEQLVEQNQVSRRADGRYEPNPVQQFIDQILRLVEDHSKAELEAHLEEYQTEVEELEREYGAASATELRGQLTEEVSSEEIREIRNVSDTWGALEMEIRLLKHALQLYDDLARLQASGDETTMPA